MLTNQYAKWFSNIDEKQEIHRKQLKQKDIIANQPRITKYMTRGINNKKKMPINIK